MFGLIASLTLASILIIGSISVMEHLNRIEAITKADNFVKKLKTCGFFYTVEAGKPPAQPSYLVEGSPDGQVEAACSFANSTYSLENLADDGWYVPPRNTSVVVTLDLPTEIAEGLNERNPTMQSTGKEGEVQTVISTGAMNQKTANELQRKSDNIVQGQSKKSTLVVRDNYFTYYFDTRMNITGFDDVRVDDSRNLSNWRPARETNAPGTPDHEKTFNIGCPIENCGYRWDDRGTRESSAYRFHRGIIAETCLHHDAKNSGTPRWETSSSEEGPLDSSYPARKILNGDQVWYLDQLKYSKDIIFQMDFYMDTSMHCGRIEANRGRWYHHSGTNKEMAESVRLRFSALYRLDYDQFDDAVKSGENINMGSGEQGVELLDVQPYWGRMRRTTPYFKNEYTTTDNVRGLNFQREYWRRKSFGDENWQDRCDTLDAPPAESEEECRIEGTNNDVDVDDFNSHSSYRNTSVWRSNRWFYRSWDRGTGGGHSAHRNMRGRDFRKDFNLNTFKNWGHRNLYTFSTEGNDMPSDLIGEWYPESENYSQVRNAIRDLVGQIEIKISMNEEDGLHLQLVQGSMSEFKNLTREINPNLLHFFPNDHDDHPNESYTDDHFGSRGRLQIWDARLTFMPKNELEADIYNKNKEEEEGELDESQLAYDPNFSLDDEVADDGGGEEGAVATFAPTGLDFSTTSEPKTIVIEDNTSGGGTPTLESVDITGGDDSEFQITSKPDDLPVDITDSDFDDSYPEVEVEYTGSGGGLAGHTATLEATVTPEGSNDSQTIEASLYSR